MNSFFESRRRFAQRTIAQIERIRRRAFKPSLGIDAYAEGLIQRFGSTRALELMRAAEKFHGTEQKH